MISREADESKASSSSATASWSRLKDPRIVRVSRALGGKDRHSKVCTVRGLRDRRVRLSVPTAIQLYDLQERLGLNQPSKVVDWLLDAAKNEIDELPPLQIPQGVSFTQMLTNQQQEYSHSSLLSRQWDPSISLGLNPRLPPHQHDDQHQQQLQQEDLHNMSGVYQITQPYFTSNAAGFDHSAAPIRPIFNFNMTADEQSKRGNDLHSS